MSPLNPTEIPELASLCGSSTSTDLAFNFSAKETTISQTVKAIPEGYHTVTPHLIVRGAAKAIEFYKKAFGAEELKRVPMPDGSIMHAELKVGNSIIMMGDEMGNGPCKSPKSYGGTSVVFYVYVENVDALWKKALDAGAKQVMPLADMFWGDRNGTLEDPFGHQWSLAQHVKDVTPEEMKKGQEEFLAKAKKH